MEYNKYIVTYGGKEEGGRRKKGLSESDESDESDGIVVRGASVAVAGLEINTYRRQGRLDHSLYFRSELCTLYTMVGSRPMVSTRGSRGGERNRR